MEKEAIKLECTTSEAIDATLKEAVFYKVLANKKILCRRFTLDPTEMWLRYHPSQKKYICVRQKPIYDLSEVIEVRRGWHTDIFHRFEKKRRSSKKFKKVKALGEDNCFSLILQNNETIDLIAPDLETRNTWVKALNALIANLKHEKREEQYREWVRSEFKLADSNGDGALTFAECESLLNHLNISMSRRQARSLFEAADKHKVKVNDEDCLDEDEFIKFFTSLHFRPEIEKLFKKYSVKRANVMGPEELLAFCHNEQKMHRVTLEECRECIERFEPKDNGAPGFLSEAGFAFMLASRIHDIFNNDHRVVYQDMNQPLNHYYIASSHNTYLLEDQLIGESSVEGYIRALKKGCRCIEIDVWDGADGEPIVFHGYTLTTKLLFNDVLRAINLHAFTASKYPLILSLEVHCSVPQQVVMANLLRTVFGEQLLTKFFTEDGNILPSPEELSKKILIKAKKVGGQSISRESSKDGADRNSIEISNVDSNFIPTNCGVAPELSDLVIYCATKKFTSIDKCSTWNYCEMCSFSESKSEALAAEYPEKYIQLTASRLCRIYPKGTRTNSSNFDPVIHWNSGCHMVALNYQTPGLPMLLNDAKFSQNGNSGYILKPGFLLGQKKPDSKLVIKLNVISGQYIPKPGQALEGEVVDPYVVVRVIGHASDEQRYKTKYIHNNGFNPLWDEHFELVINVPELAFLVFQVHDQAIRVDQLLGQFALPVTSIAEGYRHVHLVDEKGNEIVPATIFVHISMKYVN